ncbi:MAG: hypothetical protein ACM3PE_11015 [Deltaproteobacteria bacterium]
MWALISFIGLFMTIVAFVGMIVMVIKRKPSWKKWLAAAIGAFLILFMSVFFSVEQQEKQAILVNDVTKIPLPLSSPEIGYARLVIPDVGTLDIPDTMQPQTKDSKQAVKAVGEIMKLPMNSDGFVVMQKGLDHYSRIMVDVYKGTPGDYAKLYVNYIATKDEIDTISETNKKAATKDLQLTGSRLLDWYTPKVENINGMTALVFNYRRQMGNNPPVVVWEYRFSNYDRLVVLIQSYRESEKELWDESFKKSLKSFRITNIITE